MHTDCNQPYTVKILLQ